MIDYLRQAYAQKPKAKVVGRKLIFENRRNTNTKITTIQKHNIVGKNI